MSEPSSRKDAVLALATGAVILGACAGAGLYLLQLTFGGSAKGAFQGWLGEGSPAPGPAATATTTVRTTATLQPPRSRGARVMPDVTMTAVDGADVKLYRDGVAPAVVTEFLLGCADCQAKFEYFPKLVPAIRAAGEEVVNVVYMGRAPQIERTFADLDFGGPVHIDKGSALQRHFGIGTFTVWLLDRHGEILFQGTPQQAEGHLEQVFELRAVQGR